MLHGFCLIMFHRIRSRFCAEQLPLCFLSSLRACNMDQSGRKLASAIQSWMKTRPANHVVVDMWFCHELGTYELNYSSFDANESVLTQVVTVSPKPFSKVVIRAVFALVDIEHHFELSGLMDAAARRAFYQDEAEKLHALWAHARDAWKRWSMKGGKFRDIFKLFNDHYLDYGGDDRQQSPEPIGSCGSSAEGSTCTSVRIPSYPAMVENLDADDDHDSDHDHECTRARQDYESTIPDYPEAPEEDAVSISSTEAVMQQEAISIGRQARGKHAAKKDAAKTSEDAAKTSKHVAKTSKHAAETSPELQTPPTKRQRLIDQQELKEIESGSVLSRPDSLGDSEVDVHDPDFQSCRQLLIEARELPGAPRSHMKMREFKPGNVTLRFKVERDVNRFWLLSDGFAKICQVTPKKTNQKGAEALTMLYKLGVKKEGLEFIKKSGLLPEPDTEEEYLNTE